MLELALVVVLAGPGSESAPCEADPALGSAPALAGVDARARHRFLAQRLATGARKARTWSLTWGLGFTVAAATQLAIAPAVDRGTRIDLYVGAASSAFGALVRAVSIPRVIREQRRLRRRPPADPGSCASVHALERALARSARWERRGRSLLMHLGAIAYNVGIGLALALGFDRPVPGIRQAVVGSTVGQIMLITQPTLSKRTLDAYRAGRIAPAVSTSAMVLPGGAGLVVGGRF